MEGGREEEGGRREGGKRQGGRGKREGGRRKGGLKRGWEMAGVRSRPLLGILLGSPPFRVIGDSNNNSINKLI